MEAILTLTQRPDKLWVLHVRLPDKWLRRFMPGSDILFMGENLGANWGEPYMEYGHRQPWSCKEMTTYSKEVAMGNVKLFSKQLSIAAESLKPPPHELFTVRLSDEGADDNSAEP